MSRPRFHLTLGTLMIIVVGVALALAFDWRLGLIVGYASCMGRSAMLGRGGSPERTWAELGRIGDTFPLLMISGMILESLALALGWRLR